MKKLLLFSAVSLLGTLAFSQKEKTKPKTFGGFGLGSSKVLIFDHTMIPIARSPYGLFFGFHVGDKAMAGKNEMEAQAPYNFKRTLSDVGYIGGAVFLKHIRFGAGIEVQDILQAGKSYEYMSTCGRFYFAGNIARYDFLFSSSIGGKVFHYFGYYTVSITEGTGFGIYANSAVAGIGPMVRWNVPSKKGKNARQPLGFGVGYNPNTKHIGILLSIISS